MTKRTRLPLHFYAQRLGRNFEICHRTPCISTRLNTGDGPSGRTNSIATIRRGSECAARLERLACFTVGKIGARLTTKIRRKRKSTLDGRLERFVKLFALLPNFFLPSGPFRLRNHVRRNDSRHDKSPIRRRKRTYRRRPGQIPMWSLQKTAV